MRRGDVVLVDWQYSDRTGSKLRPAIIVQADFLNSGMADTVLIQVTGTTRDPMIEVELDPAVEPSAGLAHVSYAICTNFLTIDQTLIIKKRGELSTTALSRIEATIKTTLDLP